MLVLIVYTITSAINTFGVQLSGTENDAMRFYNSAVAWAEDGKWAFQASAALYIELLGFSFRVLGTTSHFVGQQFSIIGVAFSTIILKKLISYFGVDRYRIGMLLLFALLPSMLFRASATLRESFEVLFVMCALYTGLRIVFDKHRRWIFLYILSIFSLVFIHKALAAFALLATIFLIFVRQPTYNLHTIRANKLWLVGLGGMLSCAIVVLVIIAGSRIGLGQTKALFTGNQNAISNVLEYKSERLGGRTEYPVRVSFSGPVALLTTLPVAALYYQFAPFPWRVSSSLDIYSLFVAWLRLALLLGAFSYWRCSRGDNKRKSGILLIMYGILTAIWATGTTNYGTADRHNLTQFWIILLLGYPVIAVFCKRHFRYRRHRELVK